MGDGLPRTFNKSHLLVSTVSFSKLGLASSLCLFYIFWLLLFPVMSFPEALCKFVGQLAHLLKTSLTEAVFQAVVGRKLSFPFNSRYTLLCWYPFRALCAPRKIQNSYQPFWFTVLVLASPQISEECDKMNIRHI